ncbi:MAG: DUF4864 domain-containing protein [Verrucomicrobia bacterium]|nr:DUF4864 domain-containing protein [Verrucomicrobiota bacterium]MBV8279595.1 DUF4864 domain-containing protein [Verrucomicrobiota bacterium]
MISGRWLLLFATLAFALGEPASAQNATELAPKPELTPQQVVEYQLSVLQHNDEPTPDAGIEKAFRFASPANQRSTGPIAHFIEMVHGPGYAALLNAREAVVARIQIEEDEAKVLTRVLSAAGSEIYYVFLLSKQSEGDHADCWMTDGVIAFQNADEDPPKVGI